MTIPLEPGPPATFGWRMPLVRGSDEIVVDAAEVTLAAKPRQTTAAPSFGTFAGTGVAVKFPKEVRLVGIELADEVAFVDPQNEVRRFVVRSTTLVDGAYVVGPPLYAIPPFPAGMFGAVLGGAVKEGKKITFPAVAGSAFVLQIAKGSQPLDLVAVAAPSIATVTTDEVPRDLSLVVAGDGGRSIWAHGGLLLPNAPQTIGFTPAAQHALSTALAAPTNPIELRLDATTASAGTIRIEASHIDGVFIARPSDQPRRVALRGTRETVTLDLPPAAAPSSATLSLSARFHGRQLNGAYDAISDELPAAGLRVHSARSAAVLAPFAPLAGSPFGSSLALASVQLPLVAFSDAEVAIELYADAAGGPGALLAPHAVRQLDARFRGWCEIVLAAPLALAAGGSGVWIVLRATKGDVLWCGETNAERASLTSTDGGATWSKPAALLGAPVAPLVQLFHATITPPTIDVELHATGVQPHSWTLARVGDGIDYEAAAGFPPSFHAFLGTTTGKGWRTPVDIRLFSRAAIDLSLDAMTFSYPIEAAVF